MDIFIKFEDAPTNEDSLQLTRLANLIEKDCDTSIQINKIDTKNGLKNGGLATGLTILGLGISAIGTFISVLSYWKSERPKYGVSINYNSIKLSMDNIQLHEIKKMISILETQNHLFNINVLISKK